MYSVLCFRSDREYDSHPFLELPISLDCFPFLISIHSTEQTQADTYKKREILRFWNEGTKKEANEMGQYQNQDFWVELNDKHIDGIDFTCTTMSSQNVLVPARWNRLHTAISPKGLWRIENNKHTTATKSNFMCNGK